MATDISASAEQVGSVEPADFRYALGHFLTGVTIVTTVDAAGGPVGMTANAFTAVSLDPPLVLVCVARTASSHGAMHQAERYAVHILTDGQRHVSAAFARSAAEGARKFDQVQWSFGQTGLPLLADYLARVECTVVARLELGDHVGYVGRVDATAANGRGEPLAFFRGQIL